MLRSIPYCDGAELTCGRLGRGEESTDHHKDSFKKLHRKRNQEIQTKLKGDRTEKEIPIAGDSDLRMFVS